MSDQRSVAFVLSNQATSSVTGWPIGFWLAELTHPYAEFEAANFRMELFGPDGGALYLDDHSDPYADNGYSADDEISKAFLADPAKRALLETTRTLAELRVDANLITGQQQHSGAEAARLVLEVLA
jgi:putative intracellular protease/amidase